MQQNTSGPGGNEFQVPQTSSSQSQQQLPIRPIQQQQQPQQVASTSLAIPNQNHLQNAQLQELESRILSLGDSTIRDDVKLKTLQDIWTQLEQVFTSGTYEKLIDKLMSVFLGLFCNTSPQFISENNTQQLRKLILEIILRISSIEAVKQHSKEVMKQMMRLISVENEDNAILAIKIIIDLGRNSGRISYSHEISSLMSAFKKMIQELTQHAIQSDMFTTRDVCRQFTNCTDEQLIFEYLKTCFHPQTVTLNGKDDKYILIPLASQSVKCLQEVPMLVVFFYQHLKTAVQTEALDFMRFGFEFLNVQIPRDNKSNINQALADDFCVAQSKFLSFVNIMGKVAAFMDVITQHGNSLVNGVLQLLEQCPADLISARREVLIALKWFTSGDLRMKFFEMVPRLTSEIALLGTGFTSIDTLRTFMYQMLADLLHHMRGKLSFELLSHVSFIFCRQLHDSTTNTQVQVMSARLLNSVSESLLKMELQNEPTRDLLLEILEALVAKLKVLAVYHMPKLFENYKEVEYDYRPPERDRKEIDDSHDRKLAIAKTARKNSEDEERVVPTIPSLSPPQRKRTRRLSLDSVEELELIDVKKIHKIGSDEALLPPPTKDGKQNSPEFILSSLSAACSPPVTLADGKNLVKYILQTCKYATQQMRETRPTSLSYNVARERDLFERLLKYGTMCMDMYCLTIKGNQLTKEDKETLESLANVFTTINQGIFRELFDKYMDVIVTRIYKNVPLQLMVNTFLVRNEVPFFASIMLSFLMSRMDQLSVSNERTALYVKLFKIIFSAIGTHHPNVEGERMLKPFLPDLIRKATVLALSAKEPINYFLLLRALFRSIGGGAHDILYGKFLPLLPNLLQFLNKLQSCQHRIQMRELFVELCLTVPVRLSSLLPYLPLLMDPLVCALNGSQTLVQQGLRTLELCVDNLQPEYLFEHMAPVRGALMQGLWRVVATSTESSSTAAAFRILGKFGGANRKMLNEPQQLEYAQLGETAYVSMEFSKWNLNGNLSIRLVLNDLMKLATEQLKQSLAQAEPPVQINGIPVPPGMNASMQPLSQSMNPPPAIPNFELRKDCMELAKSVLLVGLGPKVILTSESIDKVIEQIKKTCQDFDVKNAPTSLYRCRKEQDRRLYVDALLVMFFGVVIRDSLRQEHGKFFNAVVRQFCLNGVLEFLGGSEWLKNAEEEYNDQCMDSSILIDALVAAFSDTNKDFCYSATVALRLINETCAAVLPDINLMSRVPFCRHLIERIMQLCHGPAWFSRLGGASALQCIIKNYPKTFVEDNIVGIIESLLEILLGTVDEIASGSVDLAMECLQKLQEKFLNPEENENVVRHCETFIEVLSKYYFHGSEDVNKKVRSLLEQCQKISQIEETYPALLTRYIRYFENDIKRTINTASLMSMADATACLAVLVEFLNVEPAIFPFHKEAGWRSFVSFILDMAQTPTAQLVTRSAFKKCENCAAHFLPPIPISDQVDILRANAYKCLVACYKYSGKKDVEHGTFGLTDTIFVDQILCEGNFERFGIVALRADLNQIGDSMSDIAHEALRHLSPISITLLKVIGNETIEKIDRVPINDVEFTPNDIKKVNRIFELNPEILTKNMAQNMINFVVRWKLNPTLTANLAKEEDTDEEIDREDLKLQSWSEVESIAIIISILSRCSDPSIITPLMALEISKFAASFEHTYTQDLIRGWLENASQILARFPREVISFFFSAESLLDDGRRALLRRIIEYPNTESLRKFLTENTSWLENVLCGKSYDSENSEWKEDTIVETVICDREYFSLTLINVISKFYPSWLNSPSSPIRKLRELWNSADFKKRYVVRSPTEEETRTIIVGRMNVYKYKVPKIVVNCFLRFLRVNHEDFELLFDVITVFIGNYITDFCFVRQFLETEVIPIMSLKWRREAFLKIMEKFETNRDKTVNDLRVVKTIQYLIIPSLQWAFERYDVDLIVGQPKGSQDGSEDDPDNLVSKLTKVIDANRQKLSDGMVIVFYQLCTLFVQHASHHIHNNNYKKQGGRLRIFMLFAWPCLTLANHQDPTMRFTGFFFLANIIERFTINRKIVLQVFQCLTTTYQQDNRDQIRKAIDILTPAVPIRMEDGHQQILSSVKKVLIEECHNLTHIQHVFQMIIRNYRVYFHVRHELITPLMNAVQRALIMPNSVVDAWNTRRMAIEVCEMVIKWDLLRNQKLEAQAQVTAEDAQEVDKMLEKLKAPLQADKEDAEPKDVDESSKDIDENLRKPISQEHIDQIVNMLVRFCVTFQQVANQQQMTPTAAELIKKSQGLLRAALKPCVWGEIAHIRQTTIEKYLTIPNDGGQTRPDGQSFHAMHCTNAQYSLDLILNLILVMPKGLLLQTLRPLQRAIISCLNSGVGAIVKLVNSLVGRLFEKTKSSVNGLEELEIFNQYINKYLNDQFGNSIKHPNSPVAHVYTAFSLLRTICTHQPGYVDAVCLSLFVKVTEKAAKEHISHLHPTATLSQDGYREKGVSELVCLSLDLLRPRIEHISLEMRTAIVFNIIKELIGKTNYDKIMDAIIKILGEMVTTAEIEFTKQTVMDQLVLVQIAVAQRFKTNKDLLNNFLNVVLRIYRVPEFRSSENGKMLWESFFWGLTNKDSTIRDEFLVVWETMWPHLSAIDMTQRMRFMLTNQDWSKFGQYFWLKHALWSMLRSVSNRVKNDATNDSGERRKKHVLMLQCASAWNTFEMSTKLDPSIFNAEVVKQEEPMETDSVDDAPVVAAAEDDEKPSTSSGTVKTLDSILAEQRAFLKEASDFDFAQTIDCVSKIVFRIPDTKCVSTMWIHLFRSFWEALTQEEKNEIGMLLVKFMSSGTHNSFISGVEKSVLAVWLEAVSSVVQLPSSLIEFISSKHECWHVGIQLLEHSTLLIPKMLNSREPLSREAVADVETLECLANLYDELSEFDQFSAIWDRRAFKPETCKAMHLKQLGDIEAASAHLETEMAALIEPLKTQFMVPPVVPQNGVPIEPAVHVTPLLDREYDHWQRMYTSCCAELLQWQAMADMANGREMQDSKDLMAAATHISDWNAVDECRNQIYGSIPPDFYPDFTIYNAMLKVMRCYEVQPPKTHKEYMKEAVQECMDTHIAKWRALPSVVTYAHSKILQSMNIVREIEESIDLRCSIEDPNPRSENTLLQDMKTLIKIWRNRTPTTSDELSYHAKMFDWRLHMYCAVLKRFEQWDQMGASGPLGASNHSILPIHSSAQGQLSMAKAARLLGFYGLSKDLMNKIAAMTQLPMLDSHQKVCDYAKNLRNWASVIRDEDLRRETFLEAIEVLEDVRFDEASREQIAKILAQRGTIHSMMDQNHLADRAFSEAAQLVDFKLMQLSGVTLNLMKCWGHHMYKLCFAANVTEETVNNYGRQALSCYLTAARIDVEQRARKYIGRALWIAKHMAICGPKSAEALNRIVKQQIHTLNVFNWVYYIPQLITELRHSPNSPFLMVLIKIVATFPMQVFYHIRDTVPLEVVDGALERDIHDKIDRHPDEMGYLDEDPLPRLIRLALRYRPTDIRVFHRLLKEIDGMREFWVERHIRYAICLKDQIFGDLSTRMDANFNELRISDTAYLLINEWRKQLTQDWEYYEKNYQLKDVDANRNDLLFEKSIYRMADDKEHPIDEYTFVRETSSTIIKNLSLTADAIQPLKFAELCIAWIKSLKRRVLTLPKSIPLELSSSYLSLFSHRIGCVEMPFDLLNVIRVRNLNSPTANQSGQYVSMVSRFEPKFKIEVRAGQVLRRFNIRGQTGKTSAFYLRTSVQTSPLTNRTAQMFTHINCLLQKDRETTRRHLHVPQSTQIRTSRRTQMLEIASIQPYVQPAECGTINLASQVEIIHPFDVLNDYFVGGSDTDISSPDDIILMFYERFANSAKSMAPPTAGNFHQNQQPYHIRHIIFEDFLRDMVPNRILYDYLMMRYPDKTMYFMLRKQFIHCLAVNSVIETHCNLTPFGVDDMLLTANTGVVTNPNYRFELFAKGTKLSDVDKSYHEVPFRLTPNFSTFVGVAQDGDLHWSMAATARCLCKKSPDIVLRPLLWDEVIDNVESDSKIYVCHATNTYVNGIMKRLENTNAADARIRRDDIVSKIARAKNTDHLARMPPTYHPWF